MNPTSENPKNEKTFSQKIWTAGFILALIVALFLFFTASVHVFILILVGALIACYFRGFGSFIQSKTKWSSKISLLVSFLTTLVFVFGLFFLAGSTASSQYADLQDKFPEILDKAEKFLNETTVGKKFADYMEDFEISSSLESFISDFFKTTFGGIGDVFVILIIGIYFTISPKVYRDGVVQLVPPKNRKRAKEIIEKISNGLTKWLLGKFFSMSLIFVLTAIALAIVGLPFWLILSLIAGLLVFVP